MSRTSVVKGNLGEREPKLATITRPGAFPINQLPLELIIYILTTTYLSFDGSFNPQRPLFTAYIRLVSRQWRDIVEDTSLFWSMFFYNNKYSSHLDMARLFLSRSRDHLLDVKIVVQDSSKLTDPSGCIFKAALARHLDRCRTISLQFSGPATQLLPFEGELPHLQFLSVGIWSGWRNQSPPLITTPAAKCRLRCLKLQGVTQSSHPFTHILSPEALIDLDVSMGDVRNEEAVEFLQRCVVLQNLRLFLLGRNDIQNQPVVPFIPPSSLSSFTAIGARSFYILAHVRESSIQHIVLEGSASSFAPLWPLFFTNAQEHTAYPKLRTFSTSSSTIIPDPCQFVSFVLAHPHIAAIEIRFSSNTHVLIKMLIEALSLSEAGKPTNIRMIRIVQDYASHYDGWDEVEGIEGNTYAEPRRLVDAVCEIVGRFPIEVCWMAGPTQSVPGAVVEAVQRMEEKGVERFTLEEGVCLPLSQTGF